MSISTSNLTRVSNSLRVYMTLSQLRQNTQQLFRQQQLVATQRQLLSVGDDPIAAEKITRLNQLLEGQDQILQNLSHAESHLSASDSALTEISDLLIDAARIASEQAGSLSSSEERAAQSVVIDGIISQLMNVGNRQYQGLYLFGGWDVKEAPLNSDLGRVAFAGGLGQRTTLVDPGFSDAYSVGLADIYGLRRELTGGYADWNRVQLATDTRLGELDGALGVGVRKGTISVTEVGPGTTFQVDLSGTETVADVVNKFNDAATAAGSSLSMAINPADRTALQVTSALGNGISISEVGGGATAADLGIRKTAPAGSTLDGENVNRRVTLTTRLADLKPGGVVLPNGVTITNGQQAATVTFAGATTVQQVLNALNNSGTGIRASVNDAADGIVVENLLSGTPLTIGEVGAGSDADALGIRSLDASVSLTRLNGYRGIHSVQGQNDLRITDAGGVVFEVNLDGAQTIGDIKTAIEAAALAAGASLTVTTSSSGAGLRLEGAGAGMISVERVGLSPVAAELGIEAVGTVAGVLEGRDVGQFYQTGVFSVLYRLRDALLADHSSEITEAGSQINALQQQVAGEAGRVGARSRAMRDRLTQTEDAVSASRVLLSELQDVDFTEAVTKFQQAQTALQASLLATSQTLNLSLLDFLN